MQIGLQELKEGNPENGLMGQGFHVEVTDMFWNQIEVEAAQHCECTELYTLVNFMLCEFHLNELCFQ